jgi:hypothetical protein
MAFFGLFKSKQESSMESLIHSITRQIFPAGQSDIARDTDRIISIVGTKIPENEVIGFVAGCKTLIILSSEDDEARFVNSIMTRAEYRITKEEAYEIYVYFEGEARQYVNVMSITQSVDGNLGDSMIGDMPWIYSSGTRTDQISGGYGDYGLVTTNPIPTISARGSSRYISKLRYCGLPVDSYRLGSTSSDVTPGSIDMYSLSCGGKDVGTIFICPYHKKNSQKAPKGFSIAED